MIRSFRDKETESVFHRVHSKKLPYDIQRRAYTKLVQIHSAIQLSDLKSIPGNRFESLKGDRDGQFSIRINRQWRVCFVWKDGDAYNVEIVDYH